MIGLFDSGLGGLTVVRRVRERLPHADLVFLSDQAHVPYGGRTPEDLHALFRQNMAWLDAQHPEAIVMACNTSCAIADRFGWPPMRARTFDIIDSAAIAVQRGGYNRIGVVATVATVASGAYTRRIQALVPRASVVEVAAPALVPLVEAGKIEGDEPRAAVAAVCAQLPDDLDAVILACTHYPILDAHFVAALGEEIPRIDPALVQAERVAAFIEEEGTPNEAGTTRYVTNADLDAFHANVSRIMREPNPLTERVELVSP